jgi:hypothetical protein
MGKKYEKTGKNMKKLEKYEKPEIFGSLKLDFFVSTEDYEDAQFHFIKS